jgi:hypothetical protein
MPGSKRWPVKPKRGAAFVLWMRAPNDSYWTRSMIAPPWRVVRIVLPRWSA